jgi:hypothetical protein
MRRDWRANSERVPRPAGLQCRRLAGESCVYALDGWLFWTWDTSEEPDFFNALQDNRQIEEALPLPIGPTAAQSRITGEGTSRWKALAVPPGTPRATWQHIDSADF